MRVLTVLRPVGEKIASRRSDLFNSDDVPFCKYSYHSYFTSSGTQALAWAIQLSLDTKEARDRRRRILVPAYGCPDLLSAIHFNDAEPVLVDTAPNSPHMDIGLAERLLREVGASAVVLPHFLGLPADVSRWRTLCDSWAIPLIEDSAQLLPQRARIRPQGDFVIFSFGRGKPLNAGGGGALLSRSSIAESQEFEWPAVSSGAASMGTRLRSQARRLVFNAAIHPAVYLLVSALPGLGVGKTKYRRLSDIVPMSACCAEALCTAYSREPVDVGLAQRFYASAVNRLSREWTDVAGNSANSDGIPLLRYPLLAPTRRVRDAAVGALRRMGVSEFYGKTLLDVEGVPTMRAFAIEQATSFASRLLTLPVHSAVRAEDCHYILRKLADVSA